jgi:hypothetical protein
LFQPPDRSGKPASGSGASRNLDVPVARRLRRRRRFDCAGKFGGTKRLLQTNYIKKLGRIEDKVKRCHARRDIPRMPSFTTDASTGVLLLAKPYRKSDLARMIRIALDS